MRSQKHDVTENEILRFSQIFLTDLNTERVNKIKNVCIKKVHLLREGSLNENIRGVVIQFDQTYFKNATIPLTPPPLPIPLETYQRASDKVYAEE